MLRKMLKEYIDEYQSNRMDHIFLYDYKLLNDIGFFECTNIIRLVKNDFKDRYKNFDINELPHIDTLSYDIFNSFFSKLTIILECADEECFIESPSKFLSYKNDTVTISQRVENPLSIDFSQLRYSLLIAYYEYLLIENPNHIFVKFINFINKNDINPISEEVFKSIHNSIDTEKCLEGRINDFFR